MIKRVWVYHDNYNDICCSEEKQNTDRIQTPYYHRDVVLKAMQRYSSLASEMDGRNAQDIDAILDRELERTDG